MIRETLSGKEASQVDVDLAKKWKADNFSNADYLKRLFAGDVQARRELLVCEYYFEQPGQEGVLGVRFNCEFEHRSTGEHKTIPVALTAEQVKSVEAIRGAGEADVLAMAYCAQPRLSRSASWFFCTPNRLS